MNGDTVSLFGNPAVYHPLARPVALRPQLSLSLPLSLNVKLSIISLHH